MSGIQPFDSIKVCPFLNSGKHSFYYHKEHYSLCTTATEPRWYHIWLKHLWLIYIILTIRKLCKRGFPFLISFKWRWHIPSNVSLHGFVFVNLVNIKALLVMIEDFKLVGHFILWLIVFPLKCCFNFIIWMFFDTLARYVRFYSWICPRAH